MFKNPLEQHRLMNPAIELSCSPITSQQVIQVKVKGQNLHHFDYHNFSVSEPDTIETTYTSYGLRDTTMDITLDTGMNRLTFILHNAYDSIEISKLVYFIPTSTIAHETYNINLIPTTPIANGAQIYANKDYYHKVLGNTNLKLYQNLYELRISKLGYQDLVFYPESDTTFQVNLIPKPQETWTIPMSFDQNKILYRNNTSLKSNYLGSRYDLAKSYPNYNRLKLIPQSGTYTLDKQSGNDTIALLTILDQPHYPSLDSIFVLNQKNGLYKKVFPNQFADSIVYDSAIQKLGHFRLNGNIESFVLMKRQKPIKNLGQRFQVHQSESFMIALADLYKDPDALPNDMTYSFVSDTTFGFTVIGDSVRIQHRNCKTGDLSFKVFSTHDQYVVSDTFSIYVTPLTITTQMIRNARCFETATGRIEIDISSPKKSLYRTVWSSFKGSYIIDSIFAGKYTVTVTDLNDCQVTKTVVVTEPDKLKVQLGADIDLELGDSIRLSPTANRNLVHFKWTPRTALSCDTCENPSIRPLQGITYQLVAMDVNDCVGKDTIHVSVPNHEIIFIPNRFSPNGDGKNDLFYVNTYNNEVRLIKKFSILNRWGDRIFEVSNVQPNDPSKGWDGNFNGQPLSTGMYMYIIEFEFINGITTIRTGDINLMR